MANKTIGDLNSIALDENSLLMGYNTGKTGNLKIKDLFNIELNDLENSSVIDAIQAGGSGGSSSSNLNNLVDGSTTGSIRGISSKEQGQDNYTLGQNAFAEGLQSAARGDCSHAEGGYTQANGPHSHAEGYYTIASGDHSHAEGYNTRATGFQSHAEGASTTALGSNAHAQGANSQAYGLNSHAQGYMTNSSGYYSHAQNYGTKANSRSQTVIGEYNIVNDINQNARGEYAFILGNGTNESRSNALTVDWGGNVQMALDQSASTGTIDRDLFNILSNENILSSTIDSNTNMLDIKKTLTTIIKNQAWNNDWYFYSSLTKPSSYNDWVDNGFYINTDYIANDSNIFQSTYKNNNFIFISSTIRLNQDIPPSINSQPVVLFDFGTKLFLGQFKIALFAGFYDTQTPVHTFQASNSQICYYSSDNTTITTSEPLFLQFVLPYTIRLK